MKLITWSYVGNYTPHIAQDALFRIDNLVGIRMIIFALQNCFTHFSETADGDRDAGFGSQNENRDVDIDINLVEHVREVLGDYNIEEPPTQMLGRAL